MLSADVGRRLCLLFRFGVTFDFVSDDIESMTWSLISIYEFKIRWSSTFLLSDLKNSPQESPDFTISVLVTVHDSNNTEQ